jgi:hypothetical protein
MLLFYDNFWQCRLTSGCMRRFDGPDRQMRQHLQARQTVGGGLRGNGA